MSRRKQTKIGCFSVIYDNEESAKQTILEINDDRIYDFKSNKEQPLIIDAGSNIGIAALFFKTLYPKSKILCFEPDPTAFKTLQKNMTLNGIQDVTLVNCAVSDKKGIIDFFGQIFVESPDARGNSIIDSWGLQRNINNVTKVNSVKLSSYITEEVDFLKLDIEGAEQQVLEDLEKKGKLNMIREIAIEVHQTNEIKQVNDIDVITDLLIKNEFDIDISEKKIVDHLPEEIKDWVREKNPRLFIIRAVRSSRR